MIQRWTFTDAETNETWRLPRNPREMASLHGARKSQAAYTADRVVRVLRTELGGFPWEFKGRSHSQADYDTFRSWEDRKDVVVTDHLARKHWVIPLSFEPTPMPQNGARNPWLMDYTFKTLYLGRLP